MSLDITLPGRYVFYLNLRSFGTGTNFCTATQNFNFSQLIDNASKYVLSVERFRIPLQTIPMFPAIDPAIQFIPKGALPLRSIILQEVYSLNDFLVQISNDADLILSLDPSGRARIDFDFTNFSLLLDPAIAAVLDMDPVLGLLLVGPNTIIGASPMFDRLDQLWKVQIEGTDGLSAVQQEIIDTNVFRTLLTDFIVPSTFSMSATNIPGTRPNGTYTLSAPVREDLLFNDASNRRFIMFRGQSPIQNVGVECAAIFRDGSRHRIRMANNSVMDIKLAFWRK